MPNSTDTLSSKIDYAPEYRFLVSPETKPEVKTESRTIGGLGIVFNKESRLMFDINLKRFFVEEIKPEAVKRAMENMADAWVDYNHMPSELLGTAWAGTARFTATPEGVEYDADVPDVDYGQRVMELTKRGDIKGSSFVFILREGGDSWERVERFGTTIWKRTIHDIAKIISMGPVFGEAYADTSVAKRSLEAWKTNHPTDEEMKEEEILKTAEARGYSPELLRLVFG